MVCSPLTLLNLLVSDLKAVMIAAFVVPIYIGSKIANFKVALA